MIILYVSCTETYRVILELLTELLETHIEYLISVFTILLFITFKQVSSFN